MQEKKGKLFFILSHWGLIMPPHLSLFPHLLFVQRSGLAGAFSMDKML